VEATTQATGKPTYKALSQLLDRLSHWSSDRAPIEYRQATSVLLGENLLNQSSSGELASDLRSYVLEKCRDSKKESGLLRRLRALPQQQRRALLLPLLELKRGAVLVLIHRAQLSRSDYLEVLRRGLTEAKGESIRYWMDATVPHIGWRKTFSLLRDSMNTNPRVGAMALYWVPGVCRGKGQLSGPLPTQELALECILLIVQYHENGHRVVDDSTLARFKKIASSYK